LLNAYNFMDGIDGIAGGQGAVAGVGWAITGWLAGIPAVLVLGMLLAGSCAGFLRHNWSPARIFMGDVGSTFLGFSFAALPLMAGRIDRSLMAVGILLLWPFLFDAVFTFLRRLLNREKVWKPHRSHLYQRLTGAGSSHSVISRLYIGLAGCGMLVAFWWVSVVRDGAASSSKLALAIGILCLLALALCIGVMRKEKASASAT
jgi:UDP-N-acetylmuramyl pentapeptide phosphotransferase/UDP-N-acetylglucosamine-1-phosphate transferase